ncbi:MAG: 23S rRNA (uridine(2552)-2'-O)-methyltransferase [Thermoplasmata archaeon]|nr:MAG: 23S rRNA (uridine(2552)-2'-O)-methyltransferase [Thermoplasmata archaeon]
MTRWYRERKEDYFYRKAKKEGYRARSSFKLKQIQQRFNIIHRNDTIVDLGAAPGGWSQVALELVGPNGLVIGVDLDMIQPISNVIFIQGDITNPETINRIKNAIGDKTADVVLSDMSPDISGIYSIDHARSVYLCEKALEVARELLRDGGNFVCKIFMGSEYENFIKEVKRWFNQVKPFTPPASRRSSSETYIIAKNFKR